MRRFLITMISAMLFSLPMLKADESAMLVQMNGTVTVTAPNSDKAVPADLNQKLPDGATVKTGPDSSASIRLEDGTIIDIKAGSEMMISPYSQKKVKKNSIILFFGTIWSKVTKNFTGEESYAVATPNGVAGVRGTEFAAMVSIDGSVRVKVKNGVVRVDDKKAAQVDLKAGEQVDVDDSGMSAVQAFSDEMADFKWQAERKIRMQREGNAIAGRVKDNIMKDKSQVDKLNKTKKKLEAQRSKLEKKLKNGSPDVRKELSKVNKELYEVERALAAIYGESRSRMAIFEHFARLVDEPDFAQLDGKAIKSDAAMIAGIKKQFEAMAAEGMDTSMESMEQMMDDYSSGKRGTLKDSGSAADDLFGPSPF